MKKKKKIVKFISGSKVIVLFSRDANFSASIGTLFIFANLRSLFGKSIFIHIAAGNVEIYLDFFSSGKNGNKMPSSVQN